MTRILEDHVLSANEAVSTTTPKPVKPAAARLHFLGFDGLRGFAALSVVLYHYLRYSASASPIIAGIVYSISINPASVDMFFILSGFLIATILMENRESPNYYKTFFARRAYRILPLYYVWIGLFFLFFFLTPGYGIVRPKGYSVLSIVGIYVAMLQNNVVAVLDGSIWVGTSWTLGIEEPFYLLAPLCVRKLTNKKAMAWFFGGVAVFSLLFRFLLHKLLGGVVAWGSEASFGAYYWTPSRICAPALGCLLAVGWATPTVKSWIQRHRNMLYGAIPLLICMFMVVDHGSELGIPHALGVQVLLDRTTLILSGLCLVAAVLAHQDGLLTRCLEWPILKHFGKISYCLYLTHWGIIWVLARFVVHEQFEQHRWLGLELAPFAFALCWGLSELSWKYFEGPLVHRGLAHRYDPPPASQPSVNETGRIQGNLLGSAEPSGATH